MKELWRPIPDFPAYEASNLGRIRRNPKCPGLSGAYAGHVLRPRPSRRGSTGQVALRKNGSTFFRYVSTLVLAAFRPEKRNTHVALHIHGLENNRLQNLRWATKREASQSGRRCCGGDSPGAGLTNAQAVQMRRLYANGGWPQRALGERFGISQTNVSGVILGDTYANAKGPRKPHRRRGKLTAEQAREIRRIGRGETAQAVADRFGVSASAVSMIRNGTNWRDI